MMGGGGLEIQRIQIYKKNVFFFSFFRRRGARVSEFYLQEIQIYKKKFFFFLGRGGGGGGGGLE